MSAPAKSHNVCADCRMRKKKCDGGRPLCSSCARRGRLCSYAPLGPDHTGAAGSVGLFSTSQKAQELNLLSGNTEGLFGTDFVPGRHGLPSWLDISGDESWTSLFAETAQDSIQGFNSVIANDLTTHRPSMSPADGNQPRRNQASLPPVPQLLVLVDIYYEALYPYLPIIHKSTLLGNIKVGGTVQVPSVLLFAICAVAADAHPDQEIQRRQAEWFAEAKVQLAQSMHSRSHALQTLQAAILVMYQAMIETEYSTSWLVLGEAWRKAVAIGCNQCDGPARQIIPALGSSPGDGWIVREESRRVVWMLFIFDRGLCFPIGLSHAVDDRQLRINLPMADDHFQAADTSEEDTLSGPMPRFALDMDQFITSVQAQYRQGSGNILQCLILGYMLLGRIGEVIYSAKFDYGKQDCLLDDLIAHLVRIRLMLPRSATHVCAADYQDSCRVVWLNVVMSVNTILLHHRPLKDDETPESVSSLATHWPHCVAAARGTATMIRQASRSSTSFAANAHLVSLLFMCCRVLVIEYCCPPNTSAKPSPHVRGPVNRDASVREDLEVFVLTFERMTEVLKKLGGKFSKGVAFCLRGGEAMAESCKKIGARDLFRSCEKWPLGAENGDMTIPP